MSQERKKNYFIPISLIMTLFAFGALSMVRIMTAHPVPLVYGTVANFELTRADGATFASEETPQGIWLANFIFTKCKGSCPVLTDKMERIQKKFAGDGLDFVSISVDPENDTPKRLTEFAKKRGLNTKNWHFLTGERKKIGKLMQESFKVGDNGDPVLHSDRFILIDGDSQIRGYYSLSDSAQLKKLPKDIAYLIKNR